MKAMPHKVEINYKMNHIPDNTQQGKIHLHQQAQTKNIYCLLVIKALKEFFKLAFFLNSNLTKMHLG